MVNKWWRMVPYGPCLHAEHLGLGHMDFVATRNAEAPVEYPLPLT